MKKKPFHVIRSAGVEFTQDEWNEYLNAVYAGEREHITTQYGQYIYNEHDICLNPSKQEIASNVGAYGYYVILKFAECGNGVWVYGIDYSIGTGGGGFGAEWSDTTDENVRSHGYPTEYDCKVAGWKYALEIISKHYYQRTPTAIRLRTMIEDEIKKLTRPQVVQLELFG